MKDKNLKVIKKIGEERYFKNFHHFIQRSERQSGMSWTDAIDAVERLRIQMKKGPEYFKGFFPEQFGDAFRIFGDNHFHQYILTVGVFQRESGEYHYNVLAI